MTFGNAAIRHGLSLIVFLKWIDYSPIHSISCVATLVSRLQWKQSFRARYAWGRIMRGLTHELRTLWPQSVYMAGVSAASQTNHSLAVDQKSGCTDGNVLFRALIYMHYVDIIMLNSNKREKSEAKWEKTCPCLQILSLHFEIIFTALAWNHFQYVHSAMRFVYVDVQCRKCQANVPSTSK